MRAVTKGQDFKGIGDEALAEYRPRCEAAIRKALPLFVTAAREVVTKRNPSKISRRRRGRIRRVSGKLRQASAPGQAPAYGDGELFRSFKTYGPAWKGNAVVHGEWGTEAPHALSLEFGTSRMRARPFMSRSQSRARKAVERILEDL